MKRGRVIEKKEFEPESIAADYMRILLLGAAVSNYKISNYFFNAASTVFFMDDIMKILIKLILAREGKSKTPINRDRAQRKANIIDLLSMAMCCKKIFFLVRSGTRMLQFYLDPIRIPSYWRVTGKIEKRSSGRTLELTPLKKELLSLPNNLLTKIFFTLVLNPYKCMVSKTKVLDYNLSACGFRCLSMCSKALNEVSLHCKSLLAKSGYYTNSCYFKCCFNFNTKTEEALISASFGSRACKEWFQSHTMDDASTEEHDTSSDEDEFMAGGDLGFFEDQVRKDLIKYDLTFDEQTRATIPVFFVTFSDEAVAGLRLGLEPPTHLLEVTNATDARVLEENPTLMGETKISPYPGRLNLDFGGWGRYQKRPSCLQIKREDVGYLMRPFAHDDKKISMTDLAVKSYYLEDVLVIRDHRSTGYYLISNQEKYDYSCTLIFLNSVDFLDF